MSQQLNKPSNTAADQQAGTSAAAESADNGEVKENVPDDIFELYDKIDKEDDDDEEAQLKTVSFEVNQDSIEVLQKRFAVFRNILVISLFLFSSNAYQIPKTMRDNQEIEVTW